MPKVTTQQSNFSNGEISPLAMGRSDLAKYPNSAKIMENFIINQLGGGAFRPGTRYVAGAKNDDKKARVMPFQYSAAQDYVMEIGEDYIRFFDNDAAAVTITAFDQYTKFLSHFDGADAATTAIDEIGATITFHGATALDTAEFKFGTASLKCPGADADFITVPHNPALEFGTGDFTIDFQFMYDGATGYQRPLELDHAQNDGIKIELMTGGANTLTVTIRGSNYAFAHAALVADTWYHLEVSRSGGSLSVFLDGTKIGVSQAAVDSVSGGTDGLTVGNNKSTTNRPFNGWIDEPRISAGIARHTADFTAPTTPYAKTDSTELVAPYQEEDLFEIAQAHKNDVKYMVHEGYSPRKISRTAVDVFSIDEVSFVRGPFLDDNTTAITITPSSATGGTTLTASSAIFLAGHVDSLWKVNDAVVKITAFTSTTEVDGTVQTEPDGTPGDIGGVAAYTAWAEGAFSAVRGYPRACAFHDGRLYYAGTTFEPQKVWGCVLFAYDNFDKGSASANDAVIFELATEDRVAIQWLISSRKSLGIGTTAGAFSADGGDGAIITPTARQVARDSNYGAALLAPKRISSFIYYIQRTLKKLREVSFEFETDTKRAIDQTLMADHILKEGDGVLDLDNQQSPNDRIWCVRSDGQLSVLTRNPEELITGWARIVAGEDSSGDGVFESVAVIPKQNADDQVWVIVKRVIDGTTKRFVEFFTTEDFDEDWDAVQVDSSVTVDNPVIIIGMTNASPGVFSATGHGFSTGDQVKINGIKLAKVAGVDSTDVNGTYLLVEGIDADKFTLTTLLGAAINTTTGNGYGAYVSGGEVRVMTTAISGLGHMEGEIVSVQADGVDTEETFTVAGGAITLTDKAAVKHIGLPYDGTIQLLKFSDGSPTGTGQTKNRRIYLSTIRVYRSLSLKIGRTESTLDKVFFGDTNAEVVTALQTKDIPKRFQTGWGKEDEIILRQDKRNPLNILSIVTRSEVTEA